MGELEIFAIRLKGLREQLNMTQTEFAEYIKVKQQTLSGYENNKMKPPIDIVKNIADKCNVSIDWLCGLSDTQTRGENFSTYKDIAKALIKIDEYTEISFCIDEKTNTLTFCFDDYIISNFMSEWEQATNVRDNTSINKEITKAMYDSWESNKLDELSKKKIRKRKKK